MQKNTFKIVLFIFLSPLSFFTYQAKLIPDLCQSAYYRTSCRGGKTWMLMANRPTPNRNATEQNYGVGLIFFLIQHTSLEEKKFDHKVVIFECLWYS